jgi:hypothetical protein
VIVNKVKRKPQTLEMFSTICQRYVPHSTPQGVIKLVCSTFVRKFTHARIGGFIKGVEEREVEKKGCRSKGGCSLRDKLYSCSRSKKKTAKHG